jgi:4-carboxymuconolactone decarboxylase
VGRGEGVSERQLADLAAFEGSPAFSEVEKRVLRYAVALTRTPADVPEELFNSLREHFSPQQMVELTSAIAWENFRARFNRGFGIEAEGFTEGAACPVHAAGGAGRTEASEDRGACALSHRDGFDEEPGEDRSATALS